MVVFYDPNKHGPQRDEVNFEIDSRIKFQMDEHTERIRQGLPIQRSCFGRRIARIMYLESRPRIRTNIKVLTRRRRFERTLFGRIWLALIQLVHAGERE